MFSLANVQFGMNEALGIIILVISIGLLVSEIKTKKAGDLITNAIIPKASFIITVLLLGVSLYNLISIGFKASSIIVTICYCLIVLVTIAYTVMYILHFIKFKKAKSEEVIEQEENKEE